MYINREILQWKIERATVYFISERYLVYYTMIITVGIIDVIINYIGPTGKCYYK